MGAAGNPGANRLWRPRAGGKSPASKGRCSRPGFTRRSFNTPAAPRGATSASRFRANTAARNWTPSSRRWGKGRRRETPGRSGNERRTDAHGRRVGNLGSRLSLAGQGVSSAPNECAAADRRADHQPGQPCGHPGRLAHLRREDQGLGSGSGAARRRPRPGDWTPPGGWSVRG